MNKQSKIAKCMYNHYEFLRITTICFPFSTMKNISELIGLNKLGGIYTQSKYK